MSEEVAYDVESGTPPPEPTPEPAPAPPQAQTPPAAPPDPESVDVGGEKMVPLAALQAEREQVRQLRQKAAQVDQAVEWVNTHKPYIEFLQNNPQLLQPRQPDPAPSPVQPQQDETLVQLARTLDLYTPDGQPDAKRAGVIRNMVKTEAQTIAQETVKPLAEMTTREKAQVNLRDAKAVTLPDGRRPNGQILDMLWQQGDARVLATPEGAAAAVAIAVGLEGFQAQPAAPPQPPATPPVVTEPAGGRNLNRPAVSEFEQRVMQLRGITPQKYAEYTRNFRSGAANVLEED